MWKGLVLGGWPSKIEVIWVPGENRFAFRKWERRPNCLPSPSIFSGAVNSLFRLDSFFGSGCAHRHPTPCGGGVSDFFSSGRFRQLQLWWSKAYQWNNRNLHVVIRLWWTPVPRRVSRSGSAVSVSGMGRFGFGSIFCRGWLVNKGNYGDFDGVPSLKLT